MFTFKFNAVPHNNQYRRDDTDHYAAKYGMSRKRTAMHSCECSLTCNLRTSCKYAFHALSRSTHKPANRDNRYPNVWVNLQLRLKKLHVAEWNINVVCVRSVQNEIVMQKPCLFLGYILETSKAPEAPSALITYRNFGDETILLTDVTSLLCVHFMRFVQRSESHDHGEWSFMNIKFHAACRHGTLIAI